jgi:hypothetical protein
MIFNLCVPHSRYHRTPEGLCGICHNTNHPDYSYCLRRETFAVSPEVAYIVTLPICLYGQVRSPVSHMQFFLQERTGLEIINVSEVDDLFCKFVGNPWSDRVRQAKKLLHVVWGESVHPFNHQRYLKMEVRELINLIITTFDDLNPGIIRCYHCKKLFDRSSKEPKETLIYGNRGVDLIVRERLNAYFCTHECFVSWYDQDGSHFEEARSRIEDNKCEIRRMARLQNLLSRLKKSLRSHDLPALRLLQGELARLENSPS